MVFDVTKVGDWCYNGHVRRNSIEELKLFMEFNNCDVIIHKPEEKGKNFEIMICDSCE